MKFLYILKTIQLCQHSQNVHEYAGKFGVTIFVLF